MNVSHRIYTTENYNSIQAFAPIELHERVFTLATEIFDPKASILELGAGSGALTQRLLDHGYDVQPVDLDGNDWQLKSKLIEANMNEEHWVASALKGVSYRQVIAVEVIEHLENPSKFFRDIHAILEPGGKLILTTPNVVSFHSAYAALKRGVLAFFSPEDCIESGHISILPWWLLQHMAKQASLTLIYRSSVCDLPMGKFKTALVKMAIRMRRLVYHPPGFDTVEGLNLVLVFEK